MMQLVPKRRASLLRPSTPVPAPARIDLKAGDSAAGAPTPIAEYKKLLATMDAHAEILEHAIELRTRASRAGVASVTLREEERRELDTLHAHLTSLHTQRATLTTATTSYTNLQTDVTAAATLVRSHLTKAHDEPIDGAYCDYAAYLLARQQLVELMVERDRTFEEVGRAAVEVMTGEQEMARVVYACRREMGRERAGKEGLRGRRVSRGDGVEPPPPYDVRDVLDYTGGSGER